MSPPKRIFHAEPAVRKAVPLLIGIMSASGGGKTYSSLRLATGMQRVYGGDIYGLDTENSRMLHYADQFKFQHVPFAPPFGSLDYLEALRWCSGKGSRIIIVDSASHEHIGEGGYLETAEEVVNRMAGDDYRKREAVKMLGWAKSGPLRQKMIEGIKQLPGCFIFCFRAKEKTKPVRRADGKTDIVEMGFMPIAGDELVYEMMVNCMLEPRSDGVPTWRSDFVGERLMMKLPAQFKDIFAERAPLSEDIGEKLAQWAHGWAPKAGGGYDNPPIVIVTRPGVGSQPFAKANVVDRGSGYEDRIRVAGTTRNDTGDVSTTIPGPETAAVPQPPPTPPDGPAGVLAAPAGIDESVTLMKWDEELSEGAKEGTLALQDVWSDVPKDLKPMLKAALDRRHKPAAQQIDMERGGDLPI